MIWEELRRWGWRGNVREEAGRVDFARWKVFGYDHVLVGSGELVEVY